MNKDLDERLVPNGEYRDALNIQVGSSEGSDVGAIENILGNQVAKLKKAFPATNWELESGSTNYYGLPLDAVCIGAVKDDINDKIYWFVTSSTVDCIIEYENQFKQVRPVLVDTQNILNFSTTKLITGINILDNYLFFTDDNSEPKRINVTKGVFSSANFTTHSTYKGRNFIESDITVIKKSPSRAPDMLLAVSDRGNNVTTSAFVNWSDEGLNDGSVKAPKAIWDEETNNVFYTQFLQSGADFEAGDILIYRADALASDDDNDFYQVTVEVEAVYSPVFIKVKLLSATNVVDDNNFLWEIELQQKESPFEKVFPRFAYRWKYEDNQFSSFSPFTDIAFLPGSFNYNSKTGYNKAMVNRARKIVLFDPSLYADSADFAAKVTDYIPIDVTKVEILYKETNNPAVYVVDEIDVNDLVFNQWQGFRITEKLIHKITQSNQLLRPWDNVPRKAKAQEIVGNRLVYGNYLQNYTLNSEIDLRASKYRDPARQLIDFKPSIKSERSYQIGVVFRDEYGRETPVFTSKNGVVRFEKSDATFSNKIRVLGFGAAPEGFTEFKYFIKDTAGQYYNLAADRFYPSDDRISAWVAFPSVERNKLTEESYIILKKGHDSNFAVTELDNKYKVLQISNEAPSEIKEKRTLALSTSVGFGDTLTNYPTGFGATSILPGFTPFPGSSVFVIASESGANGIGDTLKNLLVAGNYIKFTSALGASNKYKVIRVDLTNTNQDIAQIYLDRAFTTDVDFLYEADNVTLRSQSINSIEIYATAVEENSSEFEGYFFAKIEKNAVLHDNVLSSSAEVIIDSNAIRGFDQLAAPNADGNIIDDDFSYAFNDASNDYETVQIWGGGHSPRRGYDEYYYNGGLLKRAAGNPSPTIPTNGNVVPDWADVGAPVEWDIVFDYLIPLSINGNTVPGGGVWDHVPQEFIAALKTEGTRLKFSNHDTVYTIQQVGNFEVVEWKDTGAGYAEVSQNARIYLKFDRDLEQTVNPNFLAGEDIIVNILGEEERLITSSRNPAIFETEPDELADLNIYYEASDAFPISEYNNTKVLNWHNCFTFGNGVESNRIRDDFNAPFVDIGTKASAVLEEPYEEERRSTGLIYSGIYNSLSGLNNLNQFIQGEKITKDLNPIYGSIQKLHTRDTNLVAMCEDKVLRILANKDALFNADGNVNVTSNNNVLGQAVPFAGEFGISKNPESFASYGYRAYFSDKKRGVVLRLSMDGLTEISGKGMSDYFWENLKDATTVIGSYDIYSDTYNLTLNNDTVCFKESSDGWPTRKSYIPEWGISLNADYYTMSNGMLWTHDNENRNTFYEGSVEKSSVQLIFNDSPNKIKNFKTLSYEGDSAWTAPLIQTDQQDGQVTTFLDKENIYYNYIRGAADTWDNSGQSGTLDLKQFAAQGIGNPSSIEPYTGNTTFTVTVKNDPIN